MKIYRYIEMKYVDQFFRDGSLKISTLAHCRSLEGTDVRGDEYEGAFMSYFIGKNPFTPVKTIQQFAPQGTMVMCCSHAHSDKLYERFKVDGCFEIEDGEQFFEVISAALALCTKFETKERGSVKYLEGRIEYHYNVDDELVMPMTIDQLARKVKELHRSGNITEQKWKEIEMHGNGL